MANDDYVTIVDKQGKQKRVLRSKDGNMLDVLQEGERMRVSMTDAMASRNQLSDAERYVLADQQYRASTQYNRPGFRVLHDQEAKDGRTVMDAEYARYERDLVSSCRHVRDDNRTVRDDIWSENIATMSNPPGHDGEPVANAEKERRLGGPNTAARRNAQTGARGSKAGDVCSINHAPGHMQWVGGELKCVADNPDDDSPEEALSDAATADARREAAYDAYEKALCNSWRTLK